jgi:homoserine kinase
MFHKSDPRVLIESGAKVRVRVPATSGNLGPGYDVLGMALDLTNEAVVWVRGLEGGRTHLSVSGEGADELHDPTQNIFALAMREALESRDLGNLSVEVFQSNRIPLRRGLGSSASAALAGVLVGLELATWAGDYRLPTKDAILAQALPFEGHPDNLVPALMGGICLCWTDGGALRHLHIDPPPELEVVVCIPEAQISTPRAREALPDKVSIKDAVFNAGRVGLLVAALCQGRLDLLGAGSEDRLHQPYRVPLLPAMGRAMMDARAAGAAGACLSGSGSSVMAWISRRTGIDPAKVGQVMVDAFQQDGHRARWLALKPNPVGAAVDRVVEKNPSHV